MPDRVLQAMHMPSPNIYEGDMIDTVDRILADLKLVAKTEHGEPLICECQHPHASQAGFACWLVGRFALMRSVATDIGNGHAAWEAALVNTLGEGDRALVLSTGTFATAWGAIAESVGVGKCTGTPPPQLDFQG